MKSNYQNKAQEKQDAIDQITEDLKEIIKKQTPQPIKCKIAKEVLFGADYVSQVKSMIGTNSTILPDSIIEADLHEAVARKNVECFIDSDRYSEYAKRVKEIAILYLCGSICHALNSRSNSQQFRAYADKNYFEMYVEFYRKANQEKNELLSEMRM